MRSEPASSSAGTAAALEIYDALRLGILRAGPVDRRPLHRRHRGRPPPADDRAAHRHGALGRRSSADTRPSTPKPSDVGGGLTSLSVLANGLPARPAVTGTCAVAQVSNRSTYGTVAYSPTPCPPKLEGDWTLDTTAYPFHDGANTISVCAVGLRHPRQPEHDLLAGRRPSTVDNSCTESPVAGGSEISAAVRPDRRRRRSPSASASRAEVTGELHDAPATRSPGRRSASSPRPSGPANRLGAGGRGEDRRRRALRLRGPGGPRPRTDAGLPPRLLPGRPRRALLRPRRTEPRRPTRRSSATAGGSSSGAGCRSPKPPRRVVILQANVVGSRRWITFRRATTGAHGRLPRRATASTRPRGRPTTASARSSRARTTIPT